MKGNRPAAPSRFSPVPARVLTSKAAQNAAPATQHGGREIDTAVREPFERRYGHDFSSVRVHDDAEAASLTKERKAKAFTVGQDIYFSSSRFAPQRSEGRALLGHELAHVAQQKQGGHSSDAEARADRAAERANRGAPVSKPDLGGAPVSVQAKPEQEVAPDTGGHQDSFNSTLDKFGFDSDALTAAHRSDIDKLAFSIALHAGMLKSARVKVGISGHTDTAGSEQYNSGLGQRRADNTKAALLEALAKQRGLEKSQLADIEASSAGEGQPKVPTKDNAKEPRNRRVEISVTITSTPSTPAADKPIDIFKVPPAGLPPRPGVVPDPKIQAAPLPSREWLENHFRDDPILKGLPKTVRDPLIGALKDADEMLAEKIIGSLPIPQQAAVTAAVKALLETLKGRSFKPPTPPPIQPDFGPQPQFPQMPGEHIFKTPPIPIPKWLGG
jgi:outer membrane protein OmpA-like peptidoglycan-associated protein